MVISVMTGTLGTTPKGLGKRAKTFVSRKTNRDNSNCSFVKIGENTKNSQ